jgi:hypothetical protein
MAGAADMEGDVLSSDSCHLSAIGKVRYLLTPMRVCLDVVQSRPNVVWLDLTPGRRQGRLWSMGQRVLAGIIASAVVAGLAVAFINNDRGADAVALHKVNLVQPQAHWSIIRRSFEPWASVVSRGSYRLTGGSGPAWVLELSAPGDSKFNNYGALVVVSAVNGSVSAASVLATS